MKRETKVLDLTQRLLRELERLNYSKDAINKYRRRAKEFHQFVSDEMKTEFFSEKAGELYLQKMYGFAWGDAISKTSHITQDAIRLVRLLGEMNQYGALLAVKKSKDISVWAKKDIDKVLAYINFIHSPDNTARTTEIRLYHLQLFYQFMAFKELESITAINEMTIREYVISMQAYSLGYTKNRLTTLRQYLSFLYEKNLINKDYATMIPRIIISEDRNVPTLWSKAEIELLLNSIDRSSPSGKRCYAMLLLAIQLGIRVSDISNLKLENLNWKSKQIEFTQQKTGKLNTLPMLDDVGWALIDYIRFARPNFESPYVFLTCVAPCHSLSPSGVGSVLKRQLRRCGIKKRVGSVSGMHSFRHALARRLLEKGTQLSEISDILGHKNFHSTSPYLKVDIEGMRDCALSLGGDF